MKKIKASLIKRLLRISGQAWSVQFWSSLSILSLSYSWTLRVSWSTLGGVWHTWSFGPRRQRKSKKSQHDIEINSYNEFFLQVPSCMYIFLTSFGMHGTCMWVLGYYLSLAWRIAWIDNGFS